MNRKLIIHIVGYIMLIEAALMLLPMLVGAIYGESDSVRAFWISIAITGAFGLICVLIRPKNKDMFAREGFVIVALAWVLLSVFGCLPFVITEKIPNFVDAFFETVSGFTTTGATILSKVEPLGYALLFWRSFTHWVGGMGVLVFVLIVLPLGGGQNMHLLRAETPGPTAGKLVPKMRKTAALLYGMYLVLTIVEIVILCAGGMPLFDSLINSFGSAGTGGFSNWTDSIAHYHSAFVDITIGIFMLAFGVNFTLYYYILIGQGKEVLKNEELRGYLGIVAFAVITITLNIQSSYPTVHRALRDAFFQVSSIITTTGFATTDFNRWPVYSKTILLGLMIVGACASSTGGGMKVSRLILLFKTGLRGVQKMIHPRSVKTVHMDGKPVDEKTLRNCQIYLICYFFIVVVSMVLVSLDNFSIETNLASVLSCFNNIGPGLGATGPAGNFGVYSYFSKIILSLDMLAGRLEIFPMLILFAPSFWRRNSRAVRSRKNQNSRKSRGAAARRARAV